MAFGKVLFEAVCDTQDQTSGTQIQMLANQLALPKMPDAGRPKNAPSVSPGGQQSSLFTVFF